MGSACRVVVEASDSGASHRLAGGAQRRVEELERRWSRFLEDSEVSRLNAAAGMPVVVSPETVQLIQTALAANAVTEGLFDPLLLRPLLAIGYDRSHEQLDEVGGVGSVAAGPRQPAKARPPAASVVDLEPDTGLVWLPEDAAFDPGGLGKGLAADIAARQLVEAGAHWVVVELGGDIAVGGRSVEHWGAPIEVVDPRSGGLAAQLLVHAGGVATSSRLRRRWVDDEGVERHHLLDPRTAAPCVSDLETVTVLGPSAARSEVLAKAALVAGSAAGRDLLVRQGASALFFETDGSMCEVVPETRRECVER